MEKSLEIKVIAVAGSRSLNGDELYERLRTELDKYADVEKIISGGAKGVCQLGERYALEKGLVYEAYLPDYAQHGKAAPHVRNSAIAEACDLLVAVWDGKSRGTKSEIDKARKAGKEVVVIEVAEEDTPDLFS